ncbi:MAG: chromosome partitioning protein [Jiangellaceae bacterium]|nr:chromosome partitioning protein [Jiangellaceae bacterium]
MTVPVLTAVTGAAWESRLVAELEHGGDLEVVRRCVDVADLLAVAGAGQARAVLLSADLRRLDREVLGRVGAAGLAVVGVAPAGDEHGARRLRQLGVTWIVAPDASAADVSAAVHAALAGVQTAPHEGSPKGSEDAGVPTSNPLVPHAGRLLAVWGPTGAPGRTTLAVNLAAEFALRDRATLLVDGDTYGGAVAQVLGLLDEAPGLAGAARAANAGRLELPTLARHARQVNPRLRVLTGITRTDRWPEIRPSSLEVVWTLVRGLAEVTVVDCGFCLEQDEELSFDTAAPRRNGATLSALEHADIVVAVGSADPVGLQRLVRGLLDLRETVPSADVTVVVNRLRKSVVGAGAADQVRTALERYAGVADVSFVPDDPSALDAALRRGQTLAETAPKSHARQAIAVLAASLAGDNVPARAHRRRRSAGTVVE